MSSSTRPMSRVRVAGGSTARSQTPAGVATTEPTTSSTMPWSVKSRRSGRKMITVKTVA
jgi:hypothetical protein